MRGIWIFASGVAALTALSTFAAPQTTRTPMSLAQFVERALERNPELRQQRERLAEADASIGVARAQVLPSIVGVATAQHRKDAVMGLVSPRFGGDPYNQYAVTAEFRQPLFVLGIFSGLGVASSERRIREVDYELAERNLIQNVLTAFYRVLLADRNLASYKEIEKIQKESLATAEQRMRIGRGQRLDVLQIKTQLALLYPKIEAQQVQWRLAAVELARLLGDLSVDEVQVTGMLDARSVLLDRERRTQPGELEQLPEFRRAELLREQADDQKSATLGKHWPSLTAVGNWGRSAYAKADLLEPSATAWNIGLELNVPLFSGLSSFYERSALSSRVAQLDALREATRDQLVATQIDAFKNLELIDKNLASAKEAHALSRDSLGEAKKNYRYATIDFLQFLSVQQAFFEAETTLNQAKYDLIVATARYYTATNLPLRELVKRLTEEGGR